MRGSFRKNPWVAEEDVDLYSSFYLYSVAHAWLDDGARGMERAAGGEPLVVGLGLWGMNDAHLGPGPVVDSELGFVQVTAMEPAGNRSLPLMSLARGAVEGCNRSARQRSGGTTFFCRSTSSEQQAARPTHRSLPW